jgi:hypothetical protein
MKLRELTIREGRRSYGDYFDDSGISARPGHDEGEPVYDPRYDRIGAGDPRKHNQHHQHVDVPHDVHIDGRKWKTFGSKSHAENVARKLRANGKTVTVHQTMEEDHDQGKRMDEMALGELRNIASNAKKIFNMLKQGRQLDTWEYSYITTSNDHLNTVAEVVATSELDESATAGATSAASIGTVVNPHISPGKARGKKSYTGSMGGGSGTKAPPQPKIVQPRNSDGTAKNGLDIKGTSLFGGPANEAAVIKRR